MKIDFESFLLRKHTRQAIQYKINSLKKFINKIRKKRKTNLDDLEYAGLEIFNASLDLYVNACSQYKLQPYDKEIVLFYAKDHYFFLDKDKNVGFKKYELGEDTKNMWKKYSATVSIHDVEGEHSNIFDAEHSNEFARLLQQHLDKVSN